MEGVVVGGGVMVLTGSDFLVIYPFVGPKWTFRFPVAQVPIYIYHPVTCQSTSSLSLVFMPVAHLKVNKRLTQNLPTSRCPWLFCLSSLLVAECL